MPSGSTWLVLWLRLGSIPPAKALLLLLLLQGPPRPGSDSFCTFEKPLQPAMNTMLLGVIELNMLYGQVPRHPD